MEFGKQVGFVGIGIVAAAPRANVFGIITTVARTAAVPAGSFTITLSQNFIRPELAVRAQAYGVQFSAGVVPGPAANQVTVETRNAAGALTDSGVDIFFTREPPTGGLFPIAVV